MRAGFLILVAILASGSVQAGDRLLLAGGEVAGSSYYSYLGTVLPLKSLASGDRLVTRWWLDRYGYEYDGGPGRVDADAFGGEAALGYVRAGERGWIQGSAGLRWTDTELDPDDPSAEARDRQRGLKLEFQGERNLGDAWRAGAILAWANEQDAYWGRLRLMHRQSATHALGGEFIAGGNDESDSTAAGLVATFQPGGGPWTLGLRGGYRWQDEDDSAYGGLELGFGF